MPHYQRNVRFILFLVLPLLSFLLGWGFSQQNISEQQGGHGQIGESNSSETIIPENNLPFSLKSKTDPKDVDLSTFWETWNTLESTYLKQENLDTKKQIHGAIKGLVRSLDDPHTVFMDPVDTADFNQSIDGEFEGIGAEISLKKGKLVIVTPLKNSPAQQAGIRAGDEILAIDDELVYDDSLFDSVVKIRGKKGEKVVLTIKRQAERNPIDITIVRDTVFYPNITWEMKDEIAYVEISKFGNDLTKEFQKMIDEISLKSPKGMVVDLRNNGGGLLDKCIAITSEFLDKKLIVSTNGGTIGLNEKNYADAGGSFLNIPLIVLINGGSASASEIFAGAISDNQRGLLLGTTTFGKGSVQSLIDLKDGSSLKVTVAEWLIPSGQSIQDNGITPHEVIETSEAELEEDIDPVLERALEILNNDENLENFARETYYMKKDNEEIYIIEYENEPTKHKTDE